MGFFRNRFSNNSAKASKKQSFLIDENVLGIDRYLASLNVNLIKVGDSNTIPLSSDDLTVANYAKERHLIVITNDEKLVKQCKFLEVPVISIGIEDLAKKVKDYAENHQK